MTHSTGSTRTLSIAAGALLLLLATGAPASAQGFIAPFLGYNFGGDAGAGCQEVFDCEDKHSNFGVAVGVIGGFFGFELDFGYSPDFFGESSDQESSVLTLMGNFMFAPKIGPVQPYGLAGLGLIKSDLEFSVSGLLDQDNNKFGYDVGGGMMVFFGEHIGVRGDVRYFHSLQKLELIGLELDEAKLDFGRASVGVVFKF
jgi:opacity protein-like surface antigen